MHAWVFLKLSYGILKESLLHPRAILVLDKASGKVSYTRATPARASAGPELPVRDFPLHSQEFRRDWEDHVRRELDLQHRELRLELERNLMAFTRLLDQKIGALTALGDVQMRLKWDPGNVSKPIFQDLQGVQRLAHEASALAERVQS